jgi:UDP-glucuronate decarboxylase
MRLMDTPFDVTGPINLGNPREFTIRQLAELVIKMTGARSKLVFKPLPSDDPKQRKPDTAMANYLLSWAPSTQLEQGLVKTIAYFELLLSNKAGVTA